ncbi:FecR family protein [Cyclobacterium lianum]|uniref:FecR family protein n=1 Tax=Cyclobacterium lianum TaxID=388280 RepID=A0A1M7QPD2_9BACT|nr:FecR domain-containing protein [Cyclobacterium lianum]SHN33268.1 FecR family protein [Cyclobacterium lianum]
MNISNYTTEDFVLDPSFKKWILHPNAALNLYWQEALLEYPHKQKAARDARAIILRLESKEQPDLSDREMSGLWKDIATKMSEPVAAENVQEEDKVIPIHAVSTLESVARNRGSRRYLFDAFGIRVAGILALAIGMGFLFRWIYSEPVIPLTDTPESVYVEHKTVPGVKSHLTLSDGSVVILNSGSELRYLKNFEKNRREVFLEGEAFFSVARDSLKPFSVNSRGSTTTALGTSFNVKAYAGETVNISLLTGKVAVDMKEDANEAVTLLPGEGLVIDTEKEQLAKTRFDKDLVIGWTRKWIIFKETPLMEAIRVLENWYGVQISIENRPLNQVLLSGKFQDETLENVLEGLKFSARFEFTIDSEDVRIIFKD